MSKFAEFYRRLATTDREAFAKRAKLSRRYIEIHLMAPAGPRKGASIIVIKRIAKASRGVLTETDVFEHFSAAA